MNLEELRNRLQALQQQQQAIMDLATNEGRDLTPEETEKFDVLEAEAGNVEASIERVTKMNNRQERMGAPVPAATHPTQGVNNSGTGTGTGTVITKLVNPAVTNRGGFKDFGEYCRAIVNASLSNNTNVDNRLTVLNANQERVGADGGFAVPPEWRSSIWEKVFDNNDLLSLCDQMQIGSNSLKLPTDENEPWSTTDGIQAYWENEGGQITQSQAVLGQLQADANKLTALVPVTEELLEDAQGMAAYIQRKAPAKMSHKINDAILRGDGNGKPTGLISHASTVEVAAEGGQTADTVVYANVRKMRTRMVPNGRSNAVWLINPAVEEQLEAMEFNSTSGLPVYLPANGVADSPYARMYGRPVIPLQECSGLGDIGDILYVNLMQYLVVTRGGLRTDVSIHMFFDTDKQAFRFIMRIGGRPWASKTTAAANGTYPMSSFVQLAAR